MFCTPSDFNIPPYAIPNLSQYPNTFQTYIDTHEAAILKKLLGVTLYNDAIAGHNALPDAWGPGLYVIGDQVTYLGSIYEALSDNTNTPPDVNPDVWLFIAVDIWGPLGQGSTVTIGGVVYEWLGIKDMLIPFIFYCWLRDTWDNNSGIGVVQAKAENAEVIAPARRLVDAYNAFAMKAAALDAYIITSNSPDVVYESYEPCYPGTLNTFGI